MLSDNQRLAYLHMMGITVWQLRTDLNLNIPDNKNAWLSNSDFYIHKLRMLPESSTSQQRNLQESEVKIWAFLIADAAADQAIRITEQQLLTRIAGAVGCQLEAIAQPIGPQEVGYICNQQTIMILLGPQAAKKYDTLTANFSKIIISHSLQSLLETPAKKSELWKQLSAHL